MTIALDHPALRSAVHDVHDTAHAIEAERRALDRRVQALLDGAWAGAAAESFGEAWDQWQAGASEVADSLAAMAGLIESTHADLTDRDTSTQVRFGALRMALRLGGEL